MRAALAPLLLLGTASAIDDVLEANRQQHQRFFADFKYDGGPNVGAAAAPKPSRNPHKANETLPYPDNLQWCLSVFNRGWGIPTSYIDILPNGQVYWATKPYLEHGAFDEYGRRTDLDSIIAIQERTLTRFGLNLYDAGVWEIALTLWGRHDVAMVYERNILYTGTTGPAGRKNGNPGGITNIRADSDDFQYGVSKTAGKALKTITYPGNVTHFTADGHTGTPSKTGVKTGPGAPFYRIIGPNYQMVDPLAGHYANAWKYPWPNDDETTKWNTYGLIHFNDWKPITGENVWSAMLGPITALGLATNNNMSDTTCGHPDHKPHILCTWEDYMHTPSQVQFGISILPALERLQATPGSLYHCPYGSKIFPPEEDEGTNVSNENNFSSYASLQVLYDALNNYTGCSGSDPLLAYGCATSKKLRDGLDKWFNLPSMLSETGEMPNGEQVVPQGGHINASGYHPIPINNVAGLAVDCQTWGMTVLTSTRMDKNFGTGTAMKVWKTTKKYAGYMKGKVLAGVGYTDLTDLNTSTPVQQNDIWSAEWTFGAINMAQELATEYKAVGNTADHDTMMTDAQSMYNEVTKLWPEGLRFPDGSYVYANKRFFIPWGWFSNPIASTCSTAWSVLQDLNYDPFRYWGGSKPQLQIPPHLSGTHPVYAPSQ